MCVRARARVCACVRACVRAFKVSDGCIRIHADILYSSWLIYCSSNEVIIQYQCYSVKPVWVVFFLRIRTHQLI